MNLNIDTEKTYILACSGGPDSMALLDMAYQSGISFIAAHVNYHVRPSSDRDEKIVTDYCQAHQIPLSVLFAPRQHQRNFENWARDLRYQFFYDLKTEYNCYGVLCAHHMDDHIETYFMQKERKIIPLYWGIQKESLYDNKLIIVRPLLSCTKKQLEDYCHTNHIPYGTDETNSDTGYTRNRIRSDIALRFSEEDKVHLAETIEEENRHLSAFYESVRMESEKLFVPYDQTAYRNTKEQLRLECLRAFLLNNGIDSRHFSIVHLKEIDALLLSGKNHHSVMQGKLFSVDYGEITVCDPPVPYSHTYDRISYISEEHYALKENGSTIEGVTLHEDDFPVTIRSYQPSDSIRLRLGKKKLNRFFIDRKIPYPKRLLWPVMVNRNNEVIFVPEIGCDIFHFSNNPTVFMIKY